MDHLKESIRAECVRKTPGMLTFWRRNFFFILAHTLYKKCELGNTALGHSLACKCVLNYDTSCTLRPTAMPDLSSQLTTRAGDAGNRYVVISGVRTLF